ncbi:MAG TPA: hypothetical protein VMD58_01370 [Acidobacteriaceae bacterium]|nr:hypothetical protein [Acidobacteriaceae bacterium]
MSSGNLYGDASQFHAPAAGQQRHYELRPLSTGEVLDRTFQVYRSRFALFAGLALLPAAVNVITGALRLFYAANQDVHIHVGVALYRVQIITATLAFVSALMSLVIYGITQAATTWAVSAVYLGEPASIPTAYSFAFKHWLRYTLIVLRQAWAAMWLPTSLLIAGIVFTPFGRRDPTFGWIAAALYVCAALALIYGVWAYLRVSLAVPAAVVESLRIRAAMKRSAQLLTTRKFRIFLLFLLLFALYLVVSVIQSPILILSMRMRGMHVFLTQAMNLGIGFLAATLIGPVGAIGICLFYFDERVRREGFDIEWMMRKLAPAPDGGTGIPAEAPQNSTEPS